MRDGFIDLEMRFEEENARDFSRAVNVMHETGTWSYAMQMHLATQHFSHIRLTTPDESFQLHFAGPVLPFCPVEQEICFEIPDQDTIEECGLVIVHHTGWGLMKVVAGE